MFKKTSKGKGGGKVSEKKSDDNSSSQELAPAMKLRKAEEFIVTTRDKEEAIEFLEKVQKKREEEGGKGRSLTENVSVDTFPAGLTDGLVLLQLYQDLSGQTVSRYCRSPTYQIQRIDNMNKFLHLATEEFAIEATFGVVELVRGDESEFVRMLQVIEKKVWGVKRREKKQEEAPPPPSLSEMDFNAIEEKEEEAHEAEQVEEEEERIEEEPQQEQPQQEQPQQEEPQQEEPQQEEPQQEEKQEEKQEETQEQKEEQKEEPKEEKKEEKKEEQKKRKPKSSGAKGVLFEAQHDYSPVDVPIEKQKHFISFNEGDILEIYNQATTGWWKGKVIESKDENIKGKMGFFPGSYVVKLELSEEEKERLEREMRREREEREREEREQEEREREQEERERLEKEREAKEKEEKARQARQRQILCVVKATHAYVSDSVPPAQQKHHLFFEKGDLIEVFSQNKNGWWKGELNGHKGVFPGSFVTVVEDKEALEKKEKEREIEREKERQREIEKQKELEKEKEKEREQKEKERKERERAATTQAIPRGNPPPGVGAGRKSTVTNSPAGGEKKKDWRRTFSTKDFGMGVKKDKKSKVQDSQMAGYGLSGDENEEKMRVAGRKRRQGVVIPGEFPYSDGQLEVLVRHFISVSVSPSSSQYSKLGGLVAMEGKEIKKIAKKPLQQWFGATVDRFQLKQQQEVEKKKIPSLSHVSMFDFFVITQLAKNYEFLNSQMHLLVRFFICRSMVPTKEQLDEMMEEVGTRGNGSEITAEILEIWFRDFRRELEREVKGMKDWGNLEGVGLYAVVLGFESEFVAMLLESDLDPANFGQNF